MINNKPILFLLIGFIFQSSSHYFINHKGYVRPPENFKFEYRNHVQKLTNSSVIDTLSVYVSDGNFIYYQFNSEITKEYSKSKYIRFFNNGRFKMGSLAKLTEFPDDINDINSGGIGYYLIKNNSVYLEFYSSINAGSSQLQYAEIDEDKNLKLFSGNSRSYLFFDFKKYYNPKDIKATNIELFKKTKSGNIKYVEPNW